MSNSNLLQFLRVSHSDLNRYSQRSVYFSRPQKLCVYDVVNGKIVPRKDLKYFREPKLTEYPIDLNDAFPTFQFVYMKNETKAMLSLYHEIRNNGVKMHSGRPADKVELTAVYSRRGTLRHILEFCYTKGFDTNIVISRKNGKLYVFESVQEHLEASDVTPVHTHHTRLCRQLFTNEPNSLPNFDAPYNNREQLQVLFRSTLGKFDMFYSGDVNGILSDTKFDQTDNVHALNKQRFVTAKQMWAAAKNKSFKMLNYWVQAYLSNIDDIYLAYKDGNSIIQSPIQQLEVWKIPKDCFWKPGVCTAFLNEFLESVEKLMWNVDSFETVYEFHLKPKERTIYYEIHQGNMEKVVIPKEYIDFVKNQNAY